MSALVYAKQTAIKCYETTKRSRYKLDYIKQKSEHMSNEISSCYPMKVDIMDTCVQIPNFVKCYFMFLFVVALNSILP